MRAPPWTVYVIGPVGGPFKIGRTQWIGDEGAWRRLDTLQTGNHLELHFWGTLTCTEAEAHNALTRYQIRGEWYEGHEKVIEFLKDHGCEKPALLLEATKTKAAIIAKLAARGLNPDGTPLTEPA